MRCVTEERPDDNPRSIPTSAGSMYSVFVGSAYAGSVGDYTVVITESAEGCAPVPTNIGCESAMEIGLLPFSLQASLEYALSPIQPTSSPSNFIPPASANPSWTNPFGPGALNNLVFFLSDTDGALTCGNIGSRCGFTRSDWGTIDIDGGAISDQLEGAIWTVGGGDFSSADMLILLDCNARGGCMATCFEDCLCSVIEDGQSCTQISPTLLSASPSPSPFSHASESPTVEDTEYGKSPSPFSYSAESPTVEDAMYERSHSPISYVTESPTDEVTAYGSDVWYGACQISQRQKTLWYHLSGNDDSECVPARLGGRYATIAVFSGECGDLSCVGESSYDNNGDQELVWEAKGGVAYHVVVRETQTSYGSNAEFSLEVEAVPCLQNDSCEASTIIASLPFVDVTSNELASREAGTSVRSCSQYSSDSRGVWYSVIGTGECLSVYVWSSLDTFIGVYAGETCDSMSCFVQERYQDRAVHFLAEDQQVYRMLVGGANSRTGDFVVTVTEGSDCPTVASNYNCTVAVPIDIIPFEITQSSELIAVSQQLLGCGVYSGRKNLYYKLRLENASCLSVSVKSTGSNNYRGLRVSLFESLSDSCAFLSCLKEGVQSSGSSHLSFKALSQKTYYIVVSDDRYSAGTPFQLSFEARNCVGNDSCATSKAIPVPFYEESTTEYSVSMLYNNASLPYSNRSSSNACSTLRTDFGYNFYRLNGLSETETCLGISIFSRSDINLAVLTGDCGALSCLGENIIWQTSADPTLRFFAEPGILYTIVVGPRTRQGGDYSIFVENMSDCPESQINSKCADAVSILSPSTDITGSLDFVLPFDGYVSGNCGLYSGDTALWYTVGPFAVDVCVRVLGSFSSESELLMLAGTTCESLSCITSFSSERSWRIRGGEKLWMALKFYRGRDRGSYRLNLQEVDCIDHDVCESGKLITEMPAIERSGNGILTSASFNRNGTDMSSICQVLGIGTFGLCGTKLLRLEMDA